MDLLSRRQGESSSCGEHYLQIRRTLANIGSRSGYPTKELIQLGLDRVLKTVHRKMVFHEIGPLEQSKQQKMNMRILEPGMLDLKKIL
jgi:hypothetical protein